MIGAHPLDLVREFHEAFGLPIAATPGLPPSEVSVLREDLLSEEVREYYDAVDMDDMVEIADALADIIYIVCGTALVYGIPLDRIFTEVHRSNMSKLNAEGKPIYRSDGKVLKPESWEPPRVADILNGLDPI